jgi:response regulator RpfG family c-di-GMP phosphodiesterase
MHPKKLILVIEDNPSRLSCLMFALSVNRYRVIGAQDMMQARRTAREHPIDAIYMYNAVPHEFTVPVIVSKTMQEGLAKLKIATFIGKGNRRVPIGREPCKPQKSDAHRSLTV